VYVFSLQAWLTNWAPLAEWAVAVGTGVLAAATWWLARRTRQGTAEIRQESKRAVTERKAAVLLDFVGHGANASALYHIAFRPLRNVLSSNADPVAVEGAQFALDRAEARPQDAYAAFFRVRAEYGDEAPAVDAAEAFLNAINRQRAVGDQVLAWAGNPGRNSHPSGWPDARRIRTSTAAERDQCLAVAVQRLG
jgi:hypothetical protein